MDRRAFVAMLAAASLVAAAPAAAQDLTGEWELTSETPRGAQTMTLVLVQDGESLTGSITMQMGGRRGGGRAGGGRTIDITDGSVEGNGFTFTMTLEFNGRSVTQTYRGTWDGDAMEGEVDGMRGARPFTGKRAG